MKVIVLHGDNSEKSYARLTSFINSAKKRGWEIVYDEFPNTPSLFGTDRLIIFRDFKLVSKNIIKNFQRFDGTLVVYHEKILPQTFLKQMPTDFKMEKYELPRMLYIFLDSIYPGNSKTAINLFHEVIKTEAVELVNYFLARHMRDLFWVKTDPSTIKVPFWRISKLKSQAVKFEKEQLEKIISNLSEIDIAVKSSKADLTKALDLFIINQLE